MPKIARDAIDFVPQTEHQPAGAVSRAAIPPEPQKQPARANNDTSAANKPTEGVIPAYDTLPNAANGAALIFVFDDAGQNLSHLARFLALPFPITVAVLPRLLYSAEAADRIRAAGKEVILHQPMQALNRAVDPGPGAIFPGMNPEEIKTITQKNIAEIAPIAGMNNHEGSLITESREAMETVLDLCRANGIYFLDSRTTAATAVPAVARTRGIKVWSRDVFLDNTPSKTDMLKELARGLGIANKAGSVIMIGHVWSPALADLLHDLYPVLTRKGYTFTTISAFSRGGN
ncbi:MAG: hypothetical protein Pg6C_09530 [Treponemataceae bacterium]|nr:MAG: hypothetical protein Pg6C_09530 [Treponemataceae bacterium]